MKIYFHIIILVSAIILSSCNDKISKEKTQNVLTDLQVDHLNIWVKDPNLAKEKLTNIGFTPIPDSLSQVHSGQGTTGRYFYFLNGYLELIFVNNQNEFDENNRINKDLDFNERVNFETNGASPFSIALSVKDYKVEKIPFEKIRYHQDWMRENVNIYSARNAKINLKEPSIFVIYPEIQYEKYETSSDLERIPNEYAIWRTFYKHSNGAQKLTSITISSTDLNPNTATIKAVNGIEILKVENGKEHLMELHFDNDVQGKSFDLRPELPLIVYL